MKQSLRWGNWFKLFNITNNWKVSKGPYISHLNEKFIEMESSCILYLNERSYPSSEEPSVYERIVKELWDEAQRQLECCGVETFADWWVWKYDHFFEKLLHIGIIWKYDNSFCDGKLLFSGVRVPLEKRVASPNPAVETSPNVHLTKFCGARRTQL